MEIGQLFTVVTSNLCMQQNGQIKLQVTLGELLCYIVTMVRGFSNTNIKSKADQKSFALFSANSMYSHCLQTHNSLDL